MRCVQFGQQGIEYEVDESLCSGTKPPNQELCNREPCPPEWVAQPFGEVALLFFMCLNALIWLLFIIAINPVIIQPVCWCACK